MPHKISVIMPVYNNTRFLKKCIDGILSQTYEDFELIILDDASTEDISSIVDSYDDERIVFSKNEENIGLTRSLNICLDAANGDLLARHDSDDFSRPTRFEKEVEAFDSPSVGLVSTWAITVDEGGKQVRDDYTDRVIRLPSEKARKVLPVRNCIMGPSAMFSRTVFDKIGYYDQSLYFAQDYNYWIRIAKFFDVRIVPEQLYVRTRNKKSVRRDGRHDEEKINIIDRVHDRATNHTIIKECNG